MRRITSCYIEEQYLEEMRLRSINFSELVNSLLTTWLQSESLTIDKLKVDIKNAENQMLLSQARHKYLLQQMYNLEEADKKEQMRKLLEVRDKWQF